MSITFAEFYAPHQQQIQVGAGTSKVIYEFDLRSLCSDYIGFIERLAVAWYPDTYIDWEIDGELVEQIKRSIGWTGDPDEPFMNPELFNPPYFVREKIKFTAYNNDTKARYFEVFCDGILRRKIT